MLALFYFPLKQGTPVGTKSSDVSILKRLRSGQTTNLDIGVVIDSRSGNKMNSTFSNSCDLGSVACGKCN